MNRVYMTGLPAGVLTGQCASRIDLPRVLALTPMYLHPAYSRSVPGAGGGVKAVGTVIPVVDVVFVGASARSSKGCPVCDEASCRRRLLAVVPNAEPHESLPSLIPTPSSFLGVRCL